MTQILLLAASLASLGAASASPPIINPGAPGEASRVLSPAQSVDLARTGHSAADIRFMQHMIVHHAQAVEMVSLIEARTKNPSIEALGRRIALSQATEIAFMRRWLEERGAPLTDEHLHSGHHASHGGSAEGHGTRGEGARGHGAHRPNTMPHDHAGRRAHHGAAPSRTPVMPGMLSPAEMAALAAAQGDAFDRAFLLGMIKHHEGAIDMANAVMASEDGAEEPEISEFVNAVIADQSAEIARMNAMLAEAS